MTARGAVTFTVFNPLLQQTQKTQLCNDFNGDQPGKNTERKIKKNKNKGMTDVKGSSVVIFALRQLYFEV